MKVNIILRVKKLSDGRFHAVRRRHIGIADAEIEDIPGKVFGKARGVKAGKRKVFRSISEMFAIIPVSIRDEK